MRSKKKETKVTFDEVLAATERAWNYHVDAVRDLLENKKSTTNGIELLRHYARSRALRSALKTLRECEL